ncbi:hypothetical protein [Deinococcus koreensis]|uniref:DUF4345 domain-containing protein n=1 Tax=Deinococcus koreensis TaxID=2054903 RepID=A0A2K3USD7_9DEIO|nr:hypothetical protein [Deinococcus koreensis]PNY79456.1 hypothetical protein CVO96_18635 [Deinococcus koreensis]
MRRLIQSALALLGFSHLVVAALFMAAPAWSFANVAPFPPFNGHFLADIGAFNLPLGAALLLAARAPERQRTLVGLALLGNVAHAASHLRDAGLHFREGGPGLPGLLLTLVPAALLLAILGLTASLRPEALR